MFTLITQHHNTMRRALTGALACAVAGLSISACGDSAATELTQTTMKFTEKDVPGMTFVDNTPHTTIGQQGPEKLSDGDQLAFSKPLLGANKRAAGTLDSSCFVTAAGNGRFDAASATCQGTATIADGQLFLSPTSVGRGRLSAGPMTGRSIAGGPLLT